MKILRISGLTVAALSLSLSTPLAALADGLLDGIVRDTLHITGTAVRGAGNVVAGTVDAAGNVTDASGRLIGKVVMPGESNSFVPSQNVVMLGTTNDVYGYSIDARRYDLRKAVGVAEKRELITHSQASDLRADLDRVATNEANAQSEHILTFDESVALARDLDNINTRLANAINVQPFDSLVATDSSGSIRMFVTTPRPLTSDVNVSQTRSVTQDGMTTTTTTTSTSAGAPSSTALFSVLDARRYRLDKMISDALDRRALEADRAQQLQSDLDRVRAELASLQTTNPTIYPEQAVLLARKLDTLDNTVATALRVNTWAPLTVIDTGSGKATIVTDQFMNVIGVRDAGPELYASTLEARRHELESALASQEASGALAQAQAHDLRADLDRVARQQAEQRATFGNADALPLAITLDYVGNQIQKSVPTYGYVPLINDSRFVVAGGRVILVDDVMIRRAELQSRIAREFAFGRITGRQHDELRAEMSRLANDEEQMRSRGSLTVRDSRELYQGFDKVGSRLDRYVAERGQSPISNR